MANIEYFDYLNLIVVNNVQLKNIFQRINFIYFQANQNEDLLLTYTLQDGESPEIMAGKLYGDKKYHWVILIVNNIQDCFYDWLLSYDELKLLSKKYWDENIKFGYTTLAEVFDYLVEINEEKRTIKYLNPKYFNDFLSKVKELI